MLPPLYGGTNTAYDVKTSVAALVGRQGESTGNVYEARDDFSHFHKVGRRTTNDQKNNREKLNSKDVLAQGDQVKLVSTMRRSAGLFGTLTEYGYALVGPLLYTWEAPRRKDSGASVHKIIEVCGAAAAANEASLFPFVVKGYTANGEIETWTPKPGNEEQRTLWVAAINEAARKKRSAASVGGGEVDE